jgi:hypothetical protein
MSDRGVVIDEPHIPDPPAARPGHTPAKILVTRRSLVLGVSRQHALDAHADALDALHGGPAVGAEEVQTDDAVGVDMWVDGYGAGSLRGNGRRGDGDVGRCDRLLRWRCSRWWW